MANSTQEAIRIASEGIAKLKTEMEGLNTVISTGSTELHSMLSADATSFKELSKLIKQVEKNTKKLNDASEKKIVVDGKIKVTQNELAKTFQSLSSQREKQIKQRERQVEKVSQLDQALRKLKASEDKVSSKAMTGRMVESVNAIGKTNDELKKMSQYYQALEKDQVKQANAIAKENTERKKANKERVREANIIASNKKALQSQKQSAETAYQKEVEAIKKANKARLTEADLIHRNKKLLKSQKESSEASYRKEVQEIKKANKARLVEADAIERNKNALKKQKDAVIEMSRPYNKLIVQHKLAKKVLQDVTVSQGINSASTKKAQLEYDRLSKKVNQANGATRSFAKGGLRSTAMGIRNLLGAFGLIGGFQLFASAIRDTFNRVREFDKSMQNLSGVFRTTRKELKPLEETIIDVAGASIRTTTEVAKLAETLATLGKSPEQIQKLIKPVVDLGIGLNATGAEAGEFLIQMLNAFGASDDEVCRYYCNN